MAKLKYDWKYGENGHQKYYEVTVNNSYLLVFANDWNPNTWMGSYDNIDIRDKTKNDRQRKKQGLEKGCATYLLQRDSLLCSASPEYMMKKVEYCFKHKMSEITK